MFLSIYIFILKWNNSNIPAYPPMINTQCQILMNLASYKHSILAFHRKIYLISNLKSNSVIVCKMMEAEKPPEAHIYRNRRLWGFSGRESQSWYHVILILTMTRSIIDSLLTFTSLKSASISHYRGFIHLQPSPRIDNSAQQQP